MLYRFRTANNLGHRRHNQLFPHWSELLKIAPGPGDTVVFVDDFSGTGDQACTAWKEVFQELLPFGAQVILILVACSVDARERIREETDMIPHCQIELTSADRLFREECRHFNEEEKETILKYCRVADPDAPMGYGKCGFVLVMAHKAPNNSVPVLHARRRGWEGLFRRHD